MNREKVLEGKIIDYKHYGFSLLALATFLYLGLILPIANKTQHTANWMLVATCSLLVLSIGCLAYSTYCQHDLNKEQ